MAISKENIEAARHYYSYLQTRTESDPDYVLNKILDELQEKIPTPKDPAYQAGADKGSYTIDLRHLDPEGKKTADEMAVELKEALRQAHIRRAIENFGYLAGTNNLTGSKNWAGTISPGTCMEIIETSLKKAHAGYEVLDPAGCKSADEIKAELKDYVARAVERRTAFDARFSSPGE